MIRKSIIGAAFALALAGAWTHGQAMSAHHGLTEDMILTALESAHVDTRAGATLQLLDRRDGASGWHDFRLDKFVVIVHGGHFTIEGDTTELN